jgi:hypothetical protein
VACILAFFGCPIGIDKLDFSDPALGSFLATHWPGIVVSVGVADRPACRPSRGLQSITVTDAVDPSISGTQLVLVLSPETAAKIGVEGASG